MIRAVADTHALLWHLFNDSRLSPTAGTFMDETQQQGHQIAVAAISLVEIIFLIERNRIDAAALDRVNTALDQPAPLLVVLPLDRRVAHILQQVSRVEIPELADRIIAATAVTYGVPVISRDGKIRTSQVATIW